MSLWSPTQVRGASAAPQLRVTLMVRGGDEGEAPCRTAAPRAQLLMGSGPFAHWREPMPSAFPATPTCCCPGPELPASCSLPPILPTLIGTICINPFPLLFSAPFFLNLFLPPSCPAGHTLCTSPRLYKMVSSCTSLHPGVSVCTRSILNSLNSWLCYLGSGSECLTWVRKHPFST